jgi:transposase
MQILYSRCCGIDVHKDSVTVCVLVYSGSAEPDIRRREFATHFKALLNLKMWLLAQKVTHVAMESTGVYWKPVWQALEGITHGRAALWPQRGMKTGCDSGILVVSRGH